MQLQTSLKRYLLLSLSGPLLLTNPVSAKAMDSAATTLEQLGSQWLNQWGRSEINLTGNSSKSLQGSGALLLPWLEDDQQLLFTQISGHFGKTTNLLNTGIGQRWFTDQGHWGYNLFYDCHFKQRRSTNQDCQGYNLFDDHFKQRRSTNQGYQGYNLFDDHFKQRRSTNQGYQGYNLFDGHFKQGHRGYDNNHVEKKTYQRLSLGLEWQYNNLSVTLNGYQPLMDKWLIADTSESNTFEYTARGFDLRCQYRIPQHPQLRLNLVGERYFGEIVHNNSIVHNRSAVTVGFDYTPIPFITASYGFNLDNAQNKAHQLQLSLTYRLGIPIAEQFKPRQIHIARSLLSNRLDLVQRNHQIILEQLIKLQEPKFENNNAGSHPQNRPPEGTQEPEVDLHAISKVKKCNSVREALALLGLSPTIISSNIEVDTIHQKIRSAYRKLARDYHPDKSSRGKTVEPNEELRAIRFETLQKAYEFLKECGLKG